MSDAQKEGGVFTVVLNYNRYALTRDMLESLRNTRGGKSRVRLVENHSTDGSAEKLRREFPEVEILEPGENMGRAGGRNYGARAAIDRGADYIFFCDNDAHVGEDCVSRLGACLERDPSAGIVGARVMCDPDGDAIFSLGTFIDWDRCFYRAIQEEPGEVPGGGLIDSALAPGTAWMVRISLFQNVGYID
ncbi:MAG: glycosyltransferase, partial [bacterium]